MTLKQVIDAYPSADILYSTIILTTMASSTILYTLYLYVIKPYQTKRARKLGNKIESRSEAESAFDVFEKLVVSLGFLLALGVLYIFYIEPQPNPIKEWSTNYLQPYIKTNVETTKVAFPDTNTSVIKNPNVKGEAKLVTNTKTDNTQYLPYREESFVSEPHFEQYVYEQELIDFLKEKGLDESQLLLDKVIILPKGYFSKTSN